MLFHDRIEAGRRLARALEERGGEPLVLVGLAGGGAVVAAEAAGVLGAPLDLVAVGEIGHPLHPEFRIGAVSEEGHLVCDEERRAHVDPEWLRSAVRAAIEGTRRLRRRCLGAREPLSLEGKTAVLVSEGMADALAARAAALAVRERRPASLVVAAPVASQQAMEDLREAADELVVLHIPDPFFGAVSEYYEVFTPVSEAEVRDSLRPSAPAVGAGAVSSAS